MKRNFSVKSVKVTGVIPSYAFQRAKYFVLELHRSMPFCFPEPEIEGVLEMEWYRRLTEWRHMYGPEIWILRRPVAVFLDDKFIGSDVELLKLTSIYNIFVESIPMKNSPLMKRKFREEYLAYLRSSKLNYCYFDICINNKFVGTLVFQLYSNILPQTCENFTNLCLGTKGDFLSYKGTRIDRIVKNGWLQGGANQYKTGGGSGGGFNANSSTIQDECYCVSHDRRGIISMANNGKNKNGPQFIITLSPNTWMDTYFVAFGQLIQGVNVLNLIENVETIRELPLQKIVIKNCGKLNLEDVDDMDAKYRKDLRDAAPKKKPKKIEKIADQIARLVMEAVTACLAAKERIPDVTHEGDVPSGINISLYFQGFYSLPSEILEESAKYLRNLRRQMLRYLKPSATEVVEVITYDLLSAVFTKHIDLDDVRETTEHFVYQRLIAGIDMEIAGQPYLKRFVDQLVSTAETMVNFISTKLNWMRRNKKKTRVFQEQMNEWIRSFVLQETFEGDDFRIVERCLTLPHEKKNPCKDKTPEEPESEECVCGRKETGKKDYNLMEICCNIKESGIDLNPRISQYFNSCFYGLKKRKSGNEGRPRVLDLIEICRYHLRMLRSEGNNQRSSARICLEKKIKQWMNEVSYISETEWIRQTVFVEDDVCLNHTEEIMYGAMTVGLIEMYYLMEEYMKRPKRKRYRTRVLVCSEKDDFFMDQGSILGIRAPVAPESSCSDSEEDDGVGSPKKGKVGGGDKKHKPCTCGDICCDCTSEPGKDEDENENENVVVDGDEVLVPPTPPPSPEESVFSGENPMPEYAGESFCTEVSDGIDVEQLLAQVTGKPADKINIKSFKWLENYILEKSCQLKSDFAGQVHSWLDTNVFSYKGFLSKHSLVTRASLLSFPLSLASLLKEENNLKSEIKDFVYDLWELYFKQMFKEALMQYPPKYESVEELKGESVRPESVLPEEENEEKGEEDECDPCSKVKLLKDDFDFDKYCRTEENTDEEPELTEKEDIPPGSPPEKEDVPPNLPTKKEDIAPVLPAEKENIPPILPPEDDVEEFEAQEESKEKVFEKSPCPIVIRELIQSSEEIRPSSPYTLPFWVEFLEEVTKRSLGLIAELSRLPRRLYFSSESQTSFDDKMKSWIEFNKFTSCTTKGKDIRDFIAEHHVSMENLDETARSFLRKKIVWDTIEKSSRPTSSILLAEELVLDLIMRAMERVEEGEDAAGKLSQDILQSLIRSATVISAETPEDDVSTRESTITADADYTETEEDLEKN